ncbi:MAG: YncE family protein [Mycobacteriales bacterium]
MKAAIGCGLILVLGACSAIPVPSAPPAPSASSIATANVPPELAARSVELPGAKGPVSLDLIAYDRAHGRVWVPVGDTGSVDVLDIGSSAFKRVDGFETTQREMHGQMRMMGPSSATIGDGVAYVGNRATNEVCAIDEKSLQRGNCLKLATAADFVTYVAATKEVWVTTPKDGSLTLLDASTPAALKSKFVIKTPGSPEGSAVDADHKLFYTNLEDTNRTLVVDIESHAIKATWSSGCSDAPHGIAVDPARGLAIVACSDGLRILDAAHDGAALGELDAGDGVDDIFYDAAKRLVYVAASNAKRLTIASIGDKGQVTVIATAATAERARNAVADTDGNTYVADAATARLLIFGAPR